MSELVSIIIPTFNRADLLLVTLESIRQQTYTHWECIMVDDGSTEDLEGKVTALCESDSRFKFLKRPDSLPKGGNVCRNLGFEKSQGEFIQWFDSDDLLLPHALEKKVAAFKESDDFVICANDLFEGTPEQIVKSYNTRPSSEYIKAFLDDNLLLNIPSFMYRRAIVAEKRFSEELTRAQDLDFVFRVITQENIQGSWIPDALVQVRLHENSITKRFQQSKEMDVQSEIRVRKMILEYTAAFLPKEKLKALRKYLNLLKQLLKMKRFDWFQEEIAKTPSISNTLKLKLQALGTMYKLTGKGLARYSKVVRSHTKE